MKPHHSFLWGCVGGVSPEVLRWFKIASTGAPFPHLNWALYAVFFVLYVLIAGAVAVAFNPDGPWKALWVGASLPAIIAVLVQAAPTAAQLTCPRKTLPFETGVLS
jgi:hypothetical protein